MENINYNEPALQCEYFDSQIVNKVLEFYKLKPEQKSKEEQTALKNEIKCLYLEEDAKLKYEIINSLADLKEEHLLTISKINQELQSNLNMIEGKYDKDDKKQLQEYKNIKVGHETVAKRARIKENNSYADLIKGEKYKRVTLHLEYTKLVYLITGKVSPIESLRSKSFEMRANLNIKRTLKNKHTWFNLVPWLMLIIIIASYAIGKSITGYSGNLGDVISNGIFVAVVATGAVYIYSQGGFDMSLGNASLMCATVAALMFNSTHNLSVSLIVAIIVGAGLGIVNAILATMLNLPVMVMTLTMMNILAAIHEAILGSRGGLISVDTGMISNVWIYALFLLIFFILCWFIFNYTKVGRRNKFIGSNKVAARFNGINLMRAGIISFAISGVGLGICGFLFACSKSGSMYGASTVLGQVGLNVVIAIVFGGMTTSGGPKSKVSCAIIGAFFSVFLDEFFAAISTPTFQVGNYSYMVKGIVFIIVSLANMWDTRSKMLASGGSIQ